MKKASELSLESKVSRTKEIVFSDMDGETVMMSVEDGKYFGIDQIGSRIWALLETPMKIKALCKQLMGEFKVGAKECEKDVLHFLSELQDNNLIVQDDAK